MIIGGFLPLSLSDFPGIPASVVFLQGCNWRCAYCHNGELLPITKESAYSEEEIFNRVIRHQNLIKGVVLTGGEPTLQPDILSFMKKIKETGLQVKLDTNGTNPELVAKVIEQKAVDFIAMDIKGPWEKYESIVGKKINREKLEKSIQVIAQSGLPHQFRTTFDPHFLNEEDVDILKTFLPSESPYKLQPYTEPKKKTTPADKHTAEAA